MRQRTPPAPRWARRDSGTTTAGRRAIAPRWRRRSVGVAGALVALASAGCGPGDGGATSWRATVDTIGDTIVVHTTTGSVWGDAGTLVAEMSVGVLEGDDAYMFGSIRGLAVGPGGRIYALDSQVPVLREYGPDGRHVRNIGRDGGGPGEYKRPDGGLAVLPDGRILLRDPGNARINVYAPDGSPAGEWPLPSGGGFSTSRRMYVDTAGNSYSMVLLDREADVTRWRYGLARMTRAGVLHDTLAAPRWDYEAPMIVGRREGSSSSNNVPFTASPSWSFSPFGYMVGGLSTDYRVELHRPGTVLRIERTWDPVPVPAAERSDAEERASHNMRNNFPGWRWNGPPVPDTKPPLRGLWVDDDGRIWVHLSQPSVEIMDAGEVAKEREGTKRMPTRFQEKVAFDVFERDGRYLGRVNAPDGLSIQPEPVIRGDTVWAATRDELDVSCIVRYRIDRAVPE